MQYLHSMVRVADIDKSLAFYCGLLGLKEMSRQESEKGRFTLIFLAAPGDEDLARERKGPMVELTHNWDPENYTGGGNFRPSPFFAADILPPFQKKIDGGGQ